MENYYKLSAYDGNEKYNNSKEIHYSFSIKSFAIQKKKHPMSFNVINNSNDIILNK